MTPRFPFFLFFTAISLPALTPHRALAGEPKRFGASETDETIRPISQREFAAAATSQIEFLKELRAWRNTLGGSARRDWKLSAMGEQKLALSMGQVAPQGFGGAGIAARWRGVEIGSTAQSEALDEALARFDALLTGEKPQNLRAPKTELNWLRAQLAASPRAQIEVMATRASREVSPLNQSWRARDFAGASAKFQLPAKWSLSGDYSRAAIERAQENEAASAWSVAASGPLAHPFGVAQARANWRSVGQGYVAPTAENGAQGARNGALELAQDLVIGPLSGNLRFGAATQRNGEAQSALAGEQLDQQSAKSAAQMRLALTPNLSLTGNGQWNSAVATRALTGQENEPADALTPAESRELSRQLTGDVGAQWNFSKALSLAVSLGVSNQNSRLESGETTDLGPQNEELRRALEVRRNSGDSDFRVRFSQRERKNSLVANHFHGNERAPVSQWRIEAARPLLGSVRLKTILDYASDAASSQSARRIEAQLQLARAARLDARYREGNLAPGLLSDEWSSVFAASSGAPKQWSARFGAGSAASGAGLGLALELVRNRGKEPDSYRMGLQFK